MYWMIDWLVFKSYKNILQQFFFTSQYGWNIVYNDVKQHIIKQKICKIHFIPEVNFYPKKMSMYTCINIY